MQMGSSCSAWLVLGLLAGCGSTPPAVAPPLATASGTAGASGTGSSSSSPAATGGASEPSAPGPLRPVAEPLWVPNFAEPTAVGALTPPQVAKVAIEQRDGLARACHELATGGENLAAGVEVAAGGDVAEVTMISRDQGMDERPLAQCIAQHVAKWRFPPLAGASNLFLPMSWEGVDELGPLSPAVVMTVVHRQRQRVAEACAAAMSVGEGRERVEVQFVVQPSGQVTDVASKGGRGSLRKCLESRVLEWTFPTSGAPTPVRVPFVFTTKK